MDTIHVGLLLHFYQPPGQLPSVLRDIVNQSYRPLLRLFERFPCARATFNINGVLTEMLEDHGFSDVLEGLQRAGERGQIEFTGSGKYHPIIPLMPAGEAERQIRLNEETNRRLLGSAWRPQGFYPPEMAWEHAPAALVRGGGHRWVVISGIACPVPWPTREVWSEETEHGDLAVLFRDDLLSNLIAFRQVDAPGFIQALGQVEPRYGDRYVVLAMDAETFGHHLPGWEEVFLGRFFELIGRGDTCPRILPAMLSDIAGHFEHGGHVIPIASSWSTSRDDLNHGNPYPLWRMRGNELHRLQWRHMQEMGTLMDLAQHFGHRDSADLRTARAFADMAWHSCQFWWASRRPHWSVNMVQRGLNMQRQAILNAARAINAGDTPDEVRHDAHERIALARTLAARLEDRLAWD